MSDIFELIKQDGKRIEIVPALPPALEKFKMPLYEAAAAVCPEVDMLFQQIQGGGFSIWRSHYFTRQTVTITGRAQIEVIELSIALKNHFISCWEGVGQPTLRACQLNFCYAPRVNNTATLYAGQQYETYDVHCEPALLEPFIEVYDDLKYFYDKVAKKEPAQLSVECMLSREMKSVLADIAEFGCRPGIYVKMLNARVQTFLGLVFEKLCSGKRSDKIIITQSLKDKAIYAKELLDKHLFDPLTITELSRLTLSNNTSIQEAFKEKFGLTIDAYIQQRRLITAKKLLMNPANSIDDVADELGYQTVSGFHKFFKRHTNCSPGDYRLRKKVK